MLEQKLTDAALINCLLRVKFVAEHLKFEDPDEWFFAFRLEAHQEGIDPPIISQTVLKLCTWECKTDTKPTFALSSVCRGNFSCLGWCNLQRHLTILKPKF